MFSDIEVEPITGELEDYHEQIVFDAICERRSELEQLIAEARNGRERSPYRKELYWLEAFSSDFRRWMNRETSE